MVMRVDHDHPEYIRQVMKTSRHNGAYYYSKEIVKNIIPNVVTDRNWVTINVPGYAFDHSIVFIHNNLHPEWYEWLKDYEDVIFVCGVPSTVDKVSHIHKAIYLPLSIDVSYVERFRTNRKTRQRAFFGRKEKAKGYDFGDADVIFNKSREALLHLMAEYREVYAVGRTAIEARVLGCDILPYDPRFPDPSFWKVLDNLQAADILQAKLDEIDN